MSDSSPLCPTCDASMVMRTAKKGRNAGNEFWGCSTYPRCKGTRNLDDGGTSPAVPDAAPGTARHSKVEWADAAVHRQEWISRYTTAGGRFRGIRTETEPRLLANCWIGVPDLPAFMPMDIASRRVVGVFRKILQRGLAPPLDPDVEDSYMASVMGQDVDPFDSIDPIKQSIGPVYDGLWANPSTVDATLCDSESPGEREFIETWIPEKLGPTAGRWFVPQARLDLIASGRGISPGGQVQADFLMCAPWLAPFIVEIDGSQHLDAAAADAARDESAALCGLEVVRIKSNEVFAGAGPGLDRVRELWSEPAPGKDSAHLGLVVFPAQMHRLLLSMVEALERGFLAGDRWVIGLEGLCTEVLADHIGPYLNLFAAIDVLWGGRSVVASEVIFVSGTDTICFRNTLGAFVRESTESRHIDVRICLEIDRYPHEHLPTFDEIPIVVVRSCSIPLDFRDPDSAGTSRERPEYDLELVAQALTIVLRSVFAKRKFRDGQLEAILEVLSGRDCAVLLPTGAGKSLIYQLAGLCLPGRTIIVDPLTALIEDQAQGLQEIGIDRVVAVTMDSLKAAGHDVMLAEISSGDALFIFVSPERLQRPEFRSALAQLAAIAPVSLAVIDEAHCVSEWGHDFRPAYLLLGTTLRKICRHEESDPLPLLALTGTASRAVLNDVLLQLEVRITNERSIIRPTSFDRPELSFEVRRVTPSNADAELQGKLTAIPKEFGSTKAVFYSPRGPRTFSGIIFCQTVKGKFGVSRAAEAAGKSLGFTPPLYAGAAPIGHDFGSWPHEKRENARGFKSNEQPVLVSTKAYGMGIDKPNIRWVIHYGMPGSIEAWYQEVGRAGRDGKQSRCYLELVEYDETRDRALLDLEADSEDLRISANVASATRDSVTTALFFLMNSFRGADAEVETLTTLVGELEPDTKPQNKEVSTGSGNDKYGDIQKSREQALSRLIRLGVIKDYTVSGNNFSIKVAGLGPSDVVDRLVDYVERSQPGRGRLVRDAVDRTGSTKLAEVIEDAARALIEFIYDTIYRSRLRSIREMWLAARSGDGESLRQRALDYLQEGDATPVLERLIQEPRFVLEDWTRELTNMQGPRDAAEWRGAAARLLQSDPEHTGLLLVRLVAEVTSGEPDLKDMEVNLSLLLERARQRFGLNDGDLTDVVEFLLDQVERESTDAFAVCAEVAIRQDIATGLIHQRVQDAALKATGDEIALSMVVLAIGLGSQYPVIADLDDELKGRVL